MACYSIRVQQLLQKFSCDIKLKMKGLAQRLRCQFLACDLEKERVERSYVQHLETCVNRVSGDDVSSLSVDTISLSTLLVFYCGRYLCRNEGTKQTVQMTAVCTMLVCVCVC